MPLARITEIRPNGSFPSQYGTNGVMYSSIVYFDDNTWGAVNHKNPQPSYRVGDEAEYTVTGTHQGTSKLKVAKPGSNFAPPPRQAAPNPVAHQPAPARVAPPTNGRTAETSPINGATVGMAMNQSLQLLTKELTHEEIMLRVVTVPFWEAVMEVASDVIRVSRHLESGHISPSVRDRVSKAVAPVSPPPRPNYQPQRPQPTEEELANLTEGNEESVPF